MPGRHREKTQGLETESQSITPPNGGRVKVPMDVKATMGHARKKNSVPTETKCNGDEVSFREQPPAARRLCWRTGTNLEWNATGNTAGGLRLNAAQPGIERSSHRTPPVNLPRDLDKVTHVMVKRAKPGPLGHSYTGPFKIEERVRISCLNLRVGSCFHGTPKFELHHLENCKPCPMSTNTTVGERAHSG